MGYIKGGVKLGNVRLESKLAYLKNTSRSILQRRLCFLVNGSLENHQAST